MSKEGFRHIFGEASRRGEDCHILQRAGLCFWHSSGDSICASAGSLPEAMQSIERLAEELATPDMLIMPDSERAKADTPSNGQGRFIEARPQ